MALPRHPNAFFPEDPINNAPVMREQERAHWLKCLEAEYKEIDDADRKDKERQEQEIAELDLSKFEVQKGKYGDFLTCTRYDLRVLLSGITDISCKPGGPKQRNRLSVHGVLYEKELPYEHINTIIEFHLVTGRIILIAVPFQVGEAVYKRVQELWAQ